MDSGHDGAPTSRRSRARPRQAQRETLCRVIDGVRCLAPTTTAVGTVPAQIGTRTVVFLVLGAFKPSALVQDHHCRRRWEVAGSTVIVPTLLDVFGQANIAVSGWINAGLIFDPIEVASIIWVRRHFQTPPRYAGL